ncbi:DUF5666 domain-containing protein [Actinoplanes solisilvae]|uniref:DUF5666 domain-containing protein n=1 Tax=Actinoplanes solisilvae TaxID=2486853 RepID=UPI000FD8FB7F|nr:DUF5666 domain-containing protein [Actinoplanes solisilvae]
MNNTETDDPTDVLTPPPDEPAETPAGDGPRGEETPDAGERIGQDEPDTGEADRNATPAETIPVAPLVVTMVPAGEPWRWWNRATPVLLAVALPVVGFLAGVLTQQKWGAEPPAQPTMVARAGLEPAAPTTGTLKMITSTSMAVETATGTTITIKIAETTKIQKPTTLAGLTVGQPITVEGRTDPDGSLTATTVTAS